MTRLAAIEAHSTPMKENRATAAARLTASYRLPPEALNGPKLADWTKKNPNVPTSSRGRNFKTTVTFWNQAIWRTPARLMAAGIQSPVRAMPKLTQFDGLSMPKRDST